MCIRDSFESKDALVVAAARSAFRRTDHPVSYTHLDVYKRQVGDHLEPGGVAQLLGNWEIPAGGRWTDRVGEWVAGSGLDAWVVQREEQDIAEYAETWARDGGAHPGTDDHNRLYTAWLDDFEQRGIERVGFGVVTLRRPGTAAPSRRPWTHLEELRGPVAPALGETVATTLDAWTALADTRAEGRLEQALPDTAGVVAADGTEERHFRPGADDPAAILLRQGSGPVSYTHLDVYKRQRACRDGHR